MKKIFFLQIAIVFFYSAMNPAWCAGPLMDGSILDNSVGVAFNSISNGKFPEAIQDEEKALKISQELYGPLHPSLVPIYNNLGTLYRFLADYKKAEQDYKWGLALLEQNFGLNDPKVASCLENLAALYSDLGRPTEAEIAARRALSVRETDPHLDLQILAQTQCLLAQIEMELHNNSQAQKLFEKALKNIENDVSPNPSLSIASYNNLAHICQTENDMTHAHAYLEKSLEIAQKSFHPDDIEISDAMTRLADFFQSQGLAEKAKSLYASAFKIDQRYVGSVYSYNSLPYLKRMAKAFFSIGDVKSSENLWQKVLETEKEAYNPRHPKVALDLIQLANVESVLGKKAEAEKDLRESLDILKSYFADDHPLIIQVQTLLKKLEK